MKKIKNLIRKVAPTWIKKSVKRLVLPIQISNSINATIVNANEVGEIIKTVKAESIETIIFPKAYGIIERASIDYKSPKLDIMKYIDATVFESSDFIYCENKVVWHKLNMPQFTKIIPSDKDLLKREYNRIFIKKPKSLIRIKVGFSLCGVASKAWSHFLLQYLPKLYLIPEIRKITDQTITIILPNYSDPQVLEVVYSYLNKIKGIEILELKNGEVAICDILYHIDNTAWLSELIEYTSPLDGMIPKLVADSLKNNLLSDYIIDKDNEESKIAVNDKIFLARDSYRNLINYTEVENYFRQKGYLVIEPHKVSLNEKIRLFREASLIVGPHSSAFSNILFCKKGTKVLMMCNFQKLFEPWIGFYINHFDIDITTICGFDEYSTDYNSSYTIPLSKIMDACDEIGF